MTDSIFDIMEDIRRDAHERKTKHEQSFPEDRMQMSKDLATEIASIAFLGQDNSLEKEEFIDKLTEDLYGHNLGLERIGDHE